MTVVPRTRGSSRVTLAIAILGTIAATSLITILIMNLWPGEMPSHHEIELSYGVETDEFRRTVSHLFGNPLVEGNRIETLLNGESLQAMLEAVQSARESVTFETYIFWEGEVGSRFVEAFAERARAGIPVHVILDWVGSSDLAEESIELMERAGVDLHRYHPPAWYVLDKLNNRTHRKILVVDGRVGFIGGVGIADHWMGDAGSEDEWRDTHFRVEGPVVAQLQAAFLDNWMKSHHQILHGPAYFPPLEERGSSLAQVMESSAEQGSESVRLSYLVSIAAARKRIQIANSYFVPDALTRKALLEARARGVTIELILPGPITDTPLLRRASLAGWGPLLRAGIAIYEYEPTMYHCKVMVVDDLWVLAGSSNLDNRSFAYNDEANINVFDEEFARQQAAQFEEDKKRSRRVTYEQWSRRPILDKLLGHVMSYFDPQL